jgi:hypothetical protein
VAAGIVDCVPDLPDLSRPDKARVYFNALITAAFRYARERGLGAPADLAEEAWRRLAKEFGEPIASAGRFAVTAVLSSAACSALAPYVVRELQRRAARHIGYGAAVLELLRRAEHLARYLACRTRRISSHRPRRARRG